MQTGLVDFSTVDVLLVSSCFSMLALPFITAVSPPGLRPGELASPCLLVHARIEEGLARKTISPHIHINLSMYWCKKLHFTEAGFCWKDLCHGTNHALWKVCICYKQPVAHNAYYITAVWYLYLMVYIAIFLPLPRQLMEELEHYIHRNPASSSTQVWKDPQLWRYGNLHHCCFWCDNTCCFYAC